MDIRQLKVFLTVAKLGGFSKAADALNLTQPMVTKIISALEKELEVQLIIRTSKSFHLTDAGKKMLALSNDLVSQFNNIYQEIGEFKRLEKGHLIIAGPPATLATFFVEFLQDVHIKYPGIHITLQECGHNDAYEIIKAYKADIGVAQMPITDKDFYIKTIIRNQSMFICNNEHKFAKRTEVSILELSNECFISLNESFKLYHDLVSNCRAAGFEPQIVYKTSLVSFIVTMIALGQGTAILPLPLVEHYRQNNIATIKLTEGIEWQIGLFIHKTNYKNIITRTIFDLAVKYFQQKSSF